jgi:hypothetical protein
MAREQGGKCSCIGGSLDPGISRHMELALADRGVQQQV